MSDEREIKLADVREAIEFLAAIGEDDAKITDDN